MKKLKKMLFFYSYVKYNANMKQIITAAALFTACISLTVCSNATHEKRGNGLEQFTEWPTTITWKGDQKEEVRSFQTNVQIYSKNDRTDTHATLNQTYRLSMSTIRERTFTRVDFDFDSSVPLRSVISDGEEFIAFNPATDEIGYRMQIEDSQSPLNRILGNQSVLSRINLSLIREEAHRLSLDMSEETDGDSRILLLELPPGLLPQNGTDRIISSRAVFNLNNETLMETSVVMIREDNTVVKTTSTPVYEELNGVPVKIGMITEIEAEDPNKIEGIEQGSPEIISGDPSDMSYKETIYEVYQDIEINSTPEHLFRLIQK